MSAKPVAPSFPRNFIDLAVRERGFLTILVISFLVAAFTYRITPVAMWVGFFFAAYSAIANDSIQTLGTFIASNRKTRWWILWAYIGGIFVVTMVFGWLRFDGDVSWQRLTSKGFETAPAEFSFLQVAAPLFLLILTRLRMPVSTSILLLTCFATSSSGVGSVLMKSVGGYVIAFGTSIVIWGTLGRWMQRRFTGRPHPAWRVVQYVSTGMLWAIWLAQDAANIAVYLPRRLNVVEMAAFVTLIFTGLGILFYQRGEKIQEVVDEKSAVADVRPASVIDFVYGLILAYKMVSSTVPMSTTWVFIGLLGGRELALAWSKAIPGLSVRDALVIMARDLLTVITGLLVSLGLAVTINDVVRHAWLPGTFTPEEGACAHIESGATKARTATAAAPVLGDVDSDAPEFVKPHVTYSVSLPAGPSGHAGWLVFESDGTERTFFLGNDVPLAVFDANGQVMATEPHAGSDACGPVDAWYVADLAAGTYAVRIGPSESGSEILVIE